MASYRQLLSRSRSGRTRVGRVRSAVTQTAPRGIGTTAAQLQRRLGNRGTQAWLSDQMPVQKIRMEDRPDEMYGRKAVEEEELLQGNFDPMQRQESEEEELLQGKFAGNEAPAQLRGNEGQAQTPTGMPDPLKTGLERLSGIDLSGVRVHQNSSKPAQFNALAYTQGQDIHLGPGQQEHLPHEGWHAVQQMQGRVKPTVQAKGVSINDNAGLEREADVMGTKALQMSHQAEAQGGRSIQNSRGQSESDNAPKFGVSQQLQATPVIMLQRRRGRRRSRTSFGQLVYVVRDRGIGLRGGNFVTNLSGFKQHVMRFQNGGDWTLVLSIHGSQNRLAAQEPPNWQRNAIFYDADAINSLFASDEQWIGWRDRFGPSRLVLASCQVSIGFERVLINNLTRHAAAQQSAYGLGAGCTPIARVPPMANAPRTRRAYRRLEPADQSSFLNQLRQFNRIFGYYGAQPVPDAQILDYFFDEAPRSRWVIVVVGVDQRDGSPRPTRIPFWNRATGPNAARFRQLCRQGIGNLRPRRRTAQPPRLPGRP